MPRPRSEPLYELGGQWIAAEPGRGNLYRFWTDARTGRTHRASLGTADLEAAKLVFAAAVVNGAPKTAASLLTLVLEDYFTARTDHLPSEAPARAAGALFLECWGNLVRANAIGPAAQESFVRASHARGHALSYVSRNLGVLAAAFAHAGIAMPVTYGEAEILGRWRDLVWKPSRTIFIPADADLARLFDAQLPENLFRWLVMELLTGGRPQAVNELAPAARVRDAGLVRLNPETRRQNKKHRPTVRTPKALAGWLDRWEREGVESGRDVETFRYCEYASRYCIRTALRRVCDDPERGVNLPALTLYSLRHKVTTVLRASRVPEDQIAVQDGHQRPNVRVTGRYGEFNPDYLADAADALDAWWRGLQRLTARPLFSHGIPANLRKRSVRAA